MAQAINSNVVIFAGIPTINRTLYHRLRFLAGDPTALIQWADGRQQLIIRDIEMERARQSARADAVACPADFVPEGGLSGDREIATAQAVAELLVRHGIQAVVADRTLPLVFAHCLQERGIVVRCDLTLGVTERRQKDEQEIEWLRHAQSVTEAVIQRTCERIATAAADADGVLLVDGAPLTSERLQREIDVDLLERGFDNEASIIASGPVGADCHHRGSGELRTGQPVIVDVFPRDRQSGYFGDCTRTVVHGDVSPALRSMHEAVVAAKHAAEQACRAGVSGETVHRAAIAVIQDRGYSVGLPQPEHPTSYCAMVHGTGHGVGLDVHEPPLLDIGGPPLLVGDALTIEPGLYCRDLGGIRVEDMVIVTPDGCINLNRLHEGLAWA